MLEIRNLSVRRAGNTVLHDINLEVAQNEIGLVLGANGAGKTTLLEALAGLHPCDEGQILLGGQDVTKLNAVARSNAGVMLLEQGRSVFANLTVEQNLMVIDGTAGAVVGAYEVFPELAAIKTRRVELLSGGEVQMLKLAMAIVRQPRLLLVDELSFGLSPKLVRRNLPMLQSLTAAGSTVLMVEQFAEAGLEVAQSACALSLGRMVLKTTTQSLKQNPDQLQRAYF